MNAIKIDNFRRSYPGVQFPEFESLAPDRCTDIRQSVARRLGLPTDAPPLEVITKLHEQAGGELGNAPDSGGLDVRITLQKAGVEAGDRVYLNWYRFDDIDEVGVDDLSRCFDDIWYPGSDDVELFDATLSWIVSISHTGRMVLRRLLVS